MRFPHLVRQLFVAALFLNTSLAAPLGGSKSPDSDTQKAVEDLKFGGGSLDEDLYIGRDSQRETLEETTSGSNDGNLAEELNSGKENDEKKNGMLVGRTHDMVGDVVNLLGDEMPNTGSTNLIEVDDFVNQQRKNGKSEEGNEQGNEEKGRNDKAKYVAEEDNDDDEGKASTTGVGILPEAGLSGSGDQAPVMGMEQALQNLAATLNIDPKLEALESAISSAQNASANATAPATAATAAATPKTTTVTVLVTDAVSAGIDAATPADATEIVPRDAPTPTATDDGLRQVTKRSPTATSIDVPDMINHKLTIPPVSLRSTTIVHQPHPTWSVDPVDADTPTSVLGDVESVLSATGLDTDIVPTAAPDDLNNNSPLSVSAPTSVRSNTVVNMADMLTVVKDDNVSRLIAGAGATGSVFPPPAPPPSTTKIVPPATDTAIDFFSSALAAATPTKLEDVLSEDPSSAVPEVITTTMLSRSVAFIPALSETSTGIPTFATFTVSVPVHITTTVAVTTDTAAATSSPSTTSEDVDVPLVVPPTLPTSGIDSLVRTPSQAPTGAETSTITQAAVSVVLPTSTTSSSSTTTSSTTTSTKDATNIFHTIIPTTASTSTTTTSRTTTTSASPASVVTSIVGGVVNKEIT